MVGREIRRRKGGRRDEKRQLGKRVACHGTWAQQIIRRSAEDHGSRSLKTSAVAKEPSREGEDCSTTSASERVEGPHLGGHVLA